MSFALRVFVRALTAVLMVPLTIIALCCAASAVWRSVMRQGGDA